MSLYIKPNTSPAQAAGEANEQGFLITLSNGKNIQWDKEKIHKQIIYTKGNYILQYGDEPAEKFETEEKSILIYLQRKHSNYGFAIPEKASLYTRATKPIFIIFFVILFLAGFYIFGLDWIARGVAAALPISTEESIGQTLYENIVPNDEINIQKTKLLNDFFKQLNYPSDYHIHLTYLDSNLVNAFALPGGQMVVMSGIINQMQSYDELAALIGHELTHINEKHVTRSLVRTAGAYILISAVVGDVTGMAAVIAQNADALRSLQFSRDLETEADENGLALMQKNNINPIGMLDLFERLKRAEQNEIPSEFLSTHPPTEKRIQHINELINASSSAKQGKRDSRPDLRKLFEQLKSSQ